MRALIALALGLSLGCGAEADAPSPANAPPAAQCPALPELVPNTLALVRSGGLAAVRSLLESELTDAQLTAVLDSGLRLIRGLGPDALQALLDALRAPLLLEAGPHLRSLLQFVAGDPEVPASFRADVTQELNRLVRRCDGASLFVAANALLTSPALPDFLGALADTLQLEAAQALLEAGRAGALGRAEFVTLVRTMLVALTQPGFSISADVVAPLRGLDLPVDAPPLSTLFASLDALLSPEGPTLGPVQDLLCCSLYDVPRCADQGPGAGAGEPVFTGLLYDLLVSDAVALDAALDTLGRLRADPTLTAALAPVGSVLRELAADPDLRSALTDLVAELLRPETARRVLPEFIAALDAGVLPEALALLTGLIEGCPRP